MITFNQPMSVRFDPKDRIPTGIQFSLEKEYPAYAVTDNERLLVKDDNNKLCFVPIHRMIIINDGFRRTEPLAESLERIIASALEARANTRIEDNSTDSGLLETTDEVGSKEDTGIAATSVGADVPPKGKRNSKPVDDTVENNKVSSAVTGINL